MTRRALKPCAGSPLCPELVAAGNYCPRHALDRNRAKGSPDERGYDKAWRKTRGLYLYRHPACENCGVTADDTDRPLHVDHIDGLGPFGPRGHDPDNLQTLCERCHGSKTAIQTGTAGGPH